MYGLLEKKNKKTATAPLVVSKPVKPVMQLYRLVMPGRRIRYTKGEANESMFTTHKVEHFDAPQLNYDDGFHFQPPAAAQQPTDIQQPATAATTGMDQTTFTLVLEAAQDASRSRFFHKKGPWANYYAAVGAVADAQVQADQLGARPYSVIPLNPPSVNTLGPTSHFYTHEVHTDTQVPMLVSHNVKFAVNALYPEPKEAYIDPSQLAAANASFHDTGVSSLRLIPYSNQVTIGRKRLTMCRPQFDLTPNAPLNYLSPDTNACDDFKSHYFDVTHDRGLFTWSLDPEHYRVPWSKHYAGAILRDHYDTLSLENGARNTWITRRGMDLGSEVGFNQRRQDISFQTEMNKTWYFRIYGTEKKGQDIVTQTHSRFR